MVYLKKKTHTHTLKDFLHHKAKVWKRLTV